jgi:hypothetical protein
VGSQPFPHCLKVLRVTARLVPAHVADDPLPTLPLSVLDLHGHGVIEGLGLFRGEADAEGNVAVAQVESRLQPFNRAPVRTLIGV